ncbi:hypothetical protein T492DRAFT_894008 [Pavlovales sp. CCMP2436]|nr:hypothetical protein T492DRAFT_894008 [Pavlovales sp. CCMP2436]
MSDRAQAQLCKVAGAADRQQKTADLSVAHAKLREKEAAAAAAARRERIHQQLKPPLPGRPATAGPGGPSAVFGGSGALSERGSAPDAPSAVWLARAADAEVGLARLRAQLEAHVGARRQAKRELDLLAHPFRSDARAEGAAADDELEAADADSTRDALRSELTFRSDQVAVLQQQIVAAEQKVRGAHEFKLGALAAVPTRASSALSLVFKMAVSARAAEEASAMRVAEAHADLASAVQLADFMGAQLDGTRAEHARALLAAEEVHQGEMRAVVDAMEAGVGSAPPAQQLASSGNAVAEAEAATRAVLEEAARLRKRVQQLEARLECAGKVAAPAVQPAPAQRKPAGPAAPTVMAAESTGARSLGRALRVVASNDDDGSEVVVKPVAKARPVKRVPMSDEESEEEDSGSEEEGDESDVDWIETEEARQKVRGAHESKLGALAAVPTRASSALSLVFKMAVSARAAEEASALRVAEAHADLASAVQLADSMGAQLDGTRAEHARALLAAEEMHQGEMRAVVDAMEAGVGSAPPAQQLASSGNAVAEAEAAVRAVLEEAARLRKRVQQLEAKLECAGKVAAPAVQPAPAQRKPARPAAPTVMAAESTGARALGRALRVVASNDDDGSEVAAKPVAKTRPVKRVPMSDEESKEEDSGSEEEEEGDESDVDWIETEEARQVIPKTQRPPHGAASRGSQLLPSPQSRDSTGSSSTGRSEGTSPLADAAAEPLSITTRRRAYGKKRAAATELEEHASVENVSLAARLLAKPSAQPPVMRAPPLVVSAPPPLVRAPSALAAEQTEACAPAAPPKRAPLGTITNAGGKPAPVGSAVAPPKRKDLYDARAAKTDMSALFQGGLE